MNNFAGYVAQLVSGIRYYGCEQGIDEPAQSMRFELISFGYIKTNPRMERGFGVTDKGAEFETKNRVDHDG